MLLYNWPLEDLYTRSKPTAWQ